MPNLSPQAQAVITAFGTQPGVTQDHVNNLQTVINASPALIDQINDAVAQGHLKRIVPLTNLHAGGEYHGKNGEMHLPLAKLATPPPNQTFDTGEVTFVLGHELQHGLNHAATMQAYRDFMKDARQAAKTDHDYTDEIGKLLAANRRDEASAEIAGWNAIISRVKITNPTPTMKDILGQTSRTSDFIDVSKTSPITYTLKPNLTLNPDFTLSPTPANLEAMGKNFFDKAPVDARLGHLGNSDYPNHYGAWPIQEAAKLERQHNPNPQMTINLSQLRLDEKLLEENGINLGTNQQPMPYYDSSTNPPRAGLFQHTITTHQHVSPIAAVLEAELAREQSQRSSSLSDQQRRIPPSGDPIVDRWIDALQDGDYATAKAVQREFANSPEGQRLWTDSLAEARAEEARQQPWLAQARDTPLFNQAMDHLDRLGPQMGQSWAQEQREQLAGTIALEARREHLPEINDLVPTRDGGLIAVWNNPHNRILDRRTGTIDPVRAAEQPLQQSMQQFSDETQHQEQQAILDAQQRQMQEQQRGLSR